MEMILQCKGIRPMLQNNGRKANPLDPHTRAIAEVSKKRNKTDEDLRELKYLDARGGAYETEDGLLGFPTEAVWRCLYDAGKAFKMGEDIKRGILFDPVTPPILVDGHEVKVDDYLLDDANIDYRPVVLMRRKVMRGRLILQPGWTGTYAFEVLDDVLNVEDLAPVIERAGRLVGLGDWRPLYGRFEGTVL